jgi:translocation and assembly module TamB
MARFRPIIFTAAGLLLGALAVGLGGVAGLTQTDAGRALLRRALLPVLRAAVPGRLHVGTIGGNLFTTLAIDSLELLEPDGTPFLRTGPIRLEYDPRDLLARRLLVRHARVERAVVTFIDYGRDDWNWKRALRGAARADAPSRGPAGFGDWIRVDSLDVIEANVAVREPWRPVDSLRGARRDSAIRANLARRDVEIRRDGDRLVKVRRWMRINAALGPSRLAHPDSAGLRLALRHASAVENDPVFWFRHVAGTFRIVKDSLWADTVRVEFAKSGGVAWGKVVWGGGLPMRWDLRLRGDSVAFSDIAWISPVLPHVGGGRTDLHIRNDPRNVRVMEYVLTGMDARALRSRLRGRMTFGVGDTLLRITDVGVDLSPVHTDLLRWMNGEPFPYDWRGALTGRVDAAGGRVDRFRLDRAVFSYADEHVPGAITRGTLAGELDVYEPALAVFRAAELRLDQFDLRTPRHVNPLFPEVNGLVSGSLVLDSVWTDVRFSRARLQHRDGPGDTSFVTGSGRVTLLDDATAFDVDLDAAPLSFTTLARSYPTLPLRGRALGPIRARGTAEDFALTTALAGAGGEVAFNGTADAFEPDFRATGTLRVTGGDLRALLGDTLLPPTALGLQAELDLRAESLATLAGTLHARLAERTSSVAGVPVYAGTAALRFEDGLARVDTLTLESAAFRGAATGALGLVAARRDTLRVRLEADSLGGIRDLAQWTRLVAPTAGPEPPLPVGGSVALRLAVAGSLDTLDAAGLRVDLDADGRDLVVGGVSAARATGRATLDDVLRAARGDVRLLLDSVAAGGVVARSVIAEATVAGAVPSRFALDLRTEADATIAVAGGATRRGDSTHVTLARFDVRTPAEADGPRALRRDAGRGSAATGALQAATTSGFALAGPAVFVVTRDGGGAVDSLAWRHDGGGTLALAGRLDADGTVSGRVRAVALPLAELGTLLRPGSPWDGHLDARLDLAGRRAGPTLDGTLALRGGRFGPVRLDGFDAGVRYAERRLAADVALVLDGTPALAATASLPLDLAFERRPKRLLDEALSGRLTADGVDLRLLESVAPALRDGTGRLDTDIRLGGSWERPRLTGRLAVTDGALTVDPLGVRLQELAARVRLAGDTVAIERLAARSGPRRGDTLAVSGTIDIASARDPAFDLQLSAREFVAIDRPRTATLAVSTARPVTLRGPRRDAVLEGGVRVDRGRLFLNSLTQRRALDVPDDLDLIDTSAVRVDAVLAGAPSALVQGLTLDNVRLDIGDDVWLRSPEANIKLGGGLRVARSVDVRDGRARLALADSLVVQRGTYQLNLGLARPTFDVERGTIRFFGDPDLDPALDIAALHVVRQQRPNSNRQDVRIRVQMGGTLNQPTLTLASADNPPLPESDMLSYLVTGEPAYALFGSRYAEQGATLALRLASSYLSSRLAGGRFDLVQVEPTALNPGEASNLRQSGLGILAATRIGVGGQLGERTFLSVTTGLCGLAPQGSGTGDALSLFAQGLGVKLERQFDRRFSAALGIEPGSSAQTCGRLGASRTFQQTPPQVGFDLLRRWAW